MGDECYTNLDFNSIPSLELVTDERQKGEADSGINLKTNNEDKCLIEMKQFLKSDLGYITYECPPEDTYEDFVKVVINLR